ncbi:hypothetical protein TNCV_4803861 [Trichonephila clavipes]|nr:hypothetical protein TNCV_4803861 [Trichonephila clavipes]
MKSVASERFLQLQKQIKVTRTHVRLLVILDNIPPFCYEHPRFLVTTADHLLEICFNAVSGIKSIAIDKWTTKTFWSDRLHYGQRRAYKKKHTFGTPAAARLENWLLSIYAIMWMTHVPLLEE